MLIRFVGKNIIFKITIVLRRKGMEGEVLNKGK